MIIFSVEHTFSRVLRPSERHCTYVTGLPDVVAALFILNDFLKQIRGLLNSRRRVKGPRAGKLIAPPRRDLATIDQRESYIMFPLATAKRHAARFPRADVARRAVEIIVAVPILRALDAATLQLKQTGREMIFPTLRFYSRDEQPAAINEWFLTVIFYIRLILSMKRSFEFIIQFFAVCIIASFL